MAGAELRVLPDAEALARAAAGELQARLRSAIGARGRAALVLSGGATPRETYRLLARRAAPAGPDWTRVAFLFGDERMVPSDDPESNYGMVEQVLLRPLGIAAEQIHRVRSELGDARAAADAYDAELREHFGLTAGAMPRIDVVLLGLGPEGHTASLFPATTALWASARLAAANWVEAKGAWRVTLTLPVLNAAACVLFLVAGAAKAEALAAVLEDDEGRVLPASRIRPAGDLVWLVDAAAASRLRRLDG